MNAGSNGMTVEAIRGDVNLSASIARLEKLKTRVHPKAQKEAEAVLNVFRKAGDRSS